MQTKNTSGGEFLWKLDVTVFVIIFLVLHFKTKISPKDCETEMPVSRRERIEAMLADDPQDSFLRYSLANELVKEGEQEKSLEILQGLMQDRPSYVPAFFRLAQQLVPLDRIAEARSALREGIDHARQQGDAHAASEMSELLISLGAFGD